MRMGALDKGIYNISVIPGADLPAPQVDEGNAIGFAEIPLEYSSISIMRTELNAVTGSYLSLNDVGRILSRSYVYFNLMLIVCLIIHLVHRHKIRKGHPPYSYLYVIIPHVILIAAFTFLTQFVTFYLFEVAQARALCASIATGFVLLLQLRGLKIHPSLANALIAVLMLLLIPATGRFYLIISATSYSIVDTVIYFTFMAILTAVAVMSFYGYQFRRKKIDS